MSPVPAVAELPFDWPASPPGMPDLLEQRPCTYLLAPVLEGLRGLRSASAAVVVTSPPYWGRRRYTDRADEVGIGDFDAYLQMLVDVFDEVARVLHPQGLLWLNIGDSAAGSGGSGGDYGPGGSYAGRRRYRQGIPPVRAGQWVSVPHRVAHALQECGWLLRADVVWDKGACRPEDLRHVRRPGESHEHLFMFARTAGYGFDPEQLVERGNVWHVPVERDGCGHAAPMPVELARRCVAVSTAPGFVLDPFAGSATALAAALACNRAGVGVDFDPGAAASAVRRLGDRLQVVELTSQVPVPDAEVPAPLTLL